MHWWFFENFIFCIFLKNTNIYILPLQIIIYGAKKCICEKNIRVYNYGEDGEVKFNKDIYLGYKVDNLLFDEENRILSVGIFGQGGFGGLAEIYPDKNFEVKIKLWRRVLYPF